MPSSTLSQGKPASAESRRSSRLAEKNKEVIDLTQDESTEASLDKEDEDETRKEGMSYGSHNAGTAELDTVSDSDSDREGNRPLRLSRGSLKSNCSLVCFYCVILMCGAF